MDRIGGLFSFSGRTDRVSYWRIQVLVALIAGAGWVVGMLAVVYSGITAFGLVALLSIAPMAVVQVATAFRRLHDRGKSAWWLLAFYVGPLATDAYVQDPSASSHIPAPALALAALLALALLLWGFVEIGFLRGASGPNRFGPAPARA